jgi:N-acetyl-alpha-D-muramate 1-phosphate uridylyltransferase
MSNKIDTIAILAGGLAKRMRPKTRTVPKAMLEVNGAPFVDHQLRLIRREGLNRVVMCLGHLGEQVVDHVGDGSRFGLSVDYSFDGPQLLGTGGALRRSLPLLGELFFVIYGDSYLDTDYGPVAESFIRSGKPGLMTVFHNRGRWDTSNVLFRNNKIICYSKTRIGPEMEYVDYGLGIFEADVLRGYPEGEAFDLSDVYSELAEKDQLTGYEVLTRFYEIGSPSGLEETARHLRKKASGARD